MKTFKSYLISILSFIIICVQLTAQPFNDNYVTIDNLSGEFKVAGTVFEPLSINYSITITEAQDGTYYLSPEWNYSSYWGYPYPGDSGRYCYCDTGDDENVALVKLGQDMQRIKQMGFNVVRINGCGMQKNKDTDEWFFPTNSYSEFFPLMEQLLDTINNHNMKAIWVLTCHKGCFNNKEGYKEFIDNVSSHFYNNRTIMGYITCCEPFYEYTVKGANDKIEVGNAAYEWYHIIKKNAPNHLVSMGLHGPETVVNWGYGVVTVDFISMHFYAKSEDLDYSNRLISKFFKWMSKNYDDIWIMGETGFSGTNNTSEQDYTTGNETEQKEFAEFNMQRGLDCGCKGYSWWQYQEVHWAEAGKPNWEDYLGLITRWRDERYKPIVPVFLNYENLNINPSNCITPSQYTNTTEGNSANVWGWVIDENYDPIEDASIVAWTPSDGLFRVLTNSNGYFRVYTTGEYPSLLMISAYNYEAKYINNPQYNQYYLLKKINHNNWTKRYTNKLDNGYLKGWKIRYYDKFYTGDFDGDGKEELLCIQIKSNAWANMYNFDNGEWTYEWTNNGNGKIHNDWTINSTNKFYVGDFNGDNRDELLAMKHYYDDCSGVKMFRFNNGQWTIEWSGNTQGLINDWELKSDDKILVGNFDLDIEDELLCIENENYGDANMYAFIDGSWHYNEGNDGDGMEWEWVVRTMDKFYVGNIYGNTRDELLCIQYTGGSNDWITFLKYDGDGSWTRIWSNNGSSSCGSCGIYPYRNKLIVGNFDTDSKDEILGIHTWATKFDFINNIPAWSWSTGNSKILSDWNINYNANCFLMRPIEEAPDYLFVIEQNGSIYNAEMFTMNYRIQGSSTILKSTNPYKGQIFESFNKLNNDKIITYPNPASDYMNININEKFDKCKLSIYDVFGKLLKTIEFYNNNEIIDLSGFPYGVYFVKLQVGDTVYNKKIIKK